MILVATTLARFAMHDPGVWSSWLATAEGLRDTSPEPVVFFAAIELDGMGLEPFAPLLDRLEELQGDWWTFTLDDGRREIRTETRLRHIAMGENLCADMATATGASRMLFLAADCCPPADALPKLLEVNHPLVGGEVTTYCLSGPEIPGYPFPVQEHMASAAFVLIRRDVFTRLRWRWDHMEGLSDDPAYHRDALELLGVRTLVRKDCVAGHYPPSIGPIETRMPGRDMSVVW